MRLFCDGINRTEKLEQRLQVGNAQMSEREYQPGATVGLHDKIIPRRRIAPRGIISDESAFLGRVTNDVVNVYCLRGFHDEAVADAIVGLEQHDRAGVFVRQTNCAATKAIIHFFADLEY